MYVLYTQSRFFVLINGSPVDSDSNGDFNFDHSTLIDTALVNTVHKWNRLTRKLARTNECKNILHIGRMVSPTAREGPLYYGIPCFFVSFFFGVESAFFLTWSVSCHCYTPSAL